MFAGKPAVEQRLEFSVRLLTIFDADFFHDGAELVLSRQDVREEHGEGTHGHYKGAHGQDAALVHKHAHVAEHHRQQCPQQVIDAGNPRHLVKEI